MQQPIDILTSLENASEHWSPEMLGRVNDPYAKVAKLLVQPAWHRHDDKDERSKWCADDFASISRAARRRC